MSQYPPPYPSPPYPTPPYPMDYGAGGDGLGAARRAGGLMFVLAALMLCGAFCCAGIGFGFSRLMADRPDIFQRVQNFPDMTPALLRAIFFAGAGLSLVAAIVLTILAIFVRRGRKGAIIISAIISVLAIVYFLFSLISVLIRGMGNASSLGGGLCAAVIPLALFVLLLVWLIQALREGGATSPAALQEQYAQHYWQYVYQQQMQQQAPAPPPINPQAPPPPSSGEPPPLP